MSADDARARFLSATQAHLTAPLVDGVGLKHVDAAAWHSAVDPLWSAQARPGLDPRLVLTQEEVARLADLDALMASRLEHHVLFVRAADDNDVVGGYWGSQDTEGRYMMIVSIVREDLRGRGLYSALVPRVVDAARAAGFREIHSRHRADNNAILVPKLRAGFVIAGFEVAPRWGLTVNLKLYLIDVVRLMHEHRIDGAHAAELRERGLPLA